MTFLYYLLTYHGDEAPATIKKHLQAVEDLQNEIEATISPYKVETLQDDINGHLDILKGFYDLYRAQEDQPQTMGEGLTEIILFLEERGTQ